MQSVRLDKSTRLNVLLTDDRPGDQGHWCYQLSRLLEPQGVYTHLAQTGREAIAFAKTHPVHAAVVDLSTPIEAGQVTRPDPGLWLVQLLQRLPNRPPFIVVTNPVYDDAAVSRLLQQALRAGAFSVLHRPLSVEQVLSVFQRLVDSAYEGSWPVSGQSSDIGSLN